MSFWNTRFLIIYISSFRSVFDFLFLCHILAFVCLIIGVFMWHSLVAKDAGISLLVLSRCLEFIRQNIHIRSVKRQSKGKIVDYINVLRKLPWSVSNATSMTNRVTDILLKTRSGQNDLINGKSVSVSSYKVILKSNIQWFSRLIW